MAFWNRKSEDPWDIDPERRRKETAVIFEEASDPAAEPPAEEEAEKEGFLSGLFGGKKAEECRKHVVYDGKPLSGTRGECGVHIHLFEKSMEADCRYEYGGSKRKDSIHGQSLLRTWAARSPVASEKTELIHTAAVMSKAESAP